MSVTHSAAEIFKSIQLQCIECTAKNTQ